jgi:nitroimidazol reductase NimA-like FMN-containing flavoprotein (pyridoxamine 5'-phosphate oxidase superfamily)
MNSESTFALDAKDCWECLRSTSIGRLAVIVNDWPEIFPVNYAIEHSALVIRTGEGTKVDAIRARPRVAFEIDGVDAEDGTAFSVVVKGNAKEINAPEDLQETLSLDVAPLQSGTKNHFIRILAEEVAGRRFPVTDPSAWETHLSHVARAPRE